MNFSGMSLRAKLTALIMSVTLLGLALAFILLSLADMRAMRAALRREAVISARLAAEYCVAPLAFGYAEETAEALTKLAALEDIAYAAAYDAGGRLFACYNCGGGDSPPRVMPPAEEERAFSRIIAVREPMVYNGRVYGTLSLGVSTRNLYRTMAGRLALLAVIGAALAALTFFFAVRAQRVISAPMLRLAELARAVARHGDYSVRTGIERSDEIGTLAAGMDAMLENLESRGRQRDSAEEALRAAHAGLERAVAERTAELKAANEELEAFTYSASHDLRAPLRRIDGFAAILEEDHAAVLPEEARGAIARIRAGCRQMAGVIDSLLKLSRLMRQSINSVPLDLSAMAEEAAANLREAEPERTVAFSAAPGLYARGDRTLIGEVLENLISNAWKFSRRTAGAKVEFGLDGGDGEGAFFVRDNGAGFDMEYASNLFRPFQRLHAASDFPGTGIGLVTCRRIIERHGGRIWAEGEPGKGAVFYFTLPGSAGRGSDAEKEGISKAEEGA
ncbi:MAG: ATP-binding protein [Elusimicrobiales bacterium]|nr:ATP-binding protein [Elusimicrobiales bacterium]